MPVRSALSPRPHARLRRAAAPLAAGALAVSGLAVAVAPAAVANPAGTGLVISEVYGAGGNNGAVLNADFIELYNPTGAAIDLNGLSVHYRSAGGGSGGSPYALSGSVPADSHFLVQMGSAGANGAALPTPDATALPAFSMAAAGGQVYLLNGTTAVTDTGDLAGRSDIVDMVGLATASSYETAPGPGAGTTQSAQRSATGADTDNNAADFSLAAPTPTAGGDGPPPPPPSDVTIAEIQGTDAAVSPLLGQTVTTRGVVTAAYPTGGFNGFVMQTEGTGGGTDDTPGASDAIYVFGSAGMAVGPEIGDLVEVTAPVAEFGGLTELVPASGGVVKLTDTPEPVTPLAAAYPTTEADREAHESELLAPTDAFTVTNNYTTNQYAEVWLATGDTPLWQPTDIAPVGTPEYDAVVADNDARKVVLDDGASINFFSSSNQSIPLPWLSLANTVRVGATATLQAPVILDFRNGAWKFQPTQQVTDEGADVVTFSDTRTPAPEPVGGDLTLATFNVLNYFNTTGEDFVAAGGTCTYYTDRFGDPVANRSCTPDGPRGAAQAEDLQRQQDKIVAAINSLGADVVSLEEIENSVKLLGETDRDDALSALVDALNAAAGSTRWAFVPSPDAADLPDLADQDVIRTAFIYDPSTVEPVGGSRVLVGDADFSNAREPLAQVFKAVGGLDADGFAVVVNHFKSKGDSDPPATGDNANGEQGAFNGDRTRQAASLVEFADAFAADRGVAKVFLTGDFNAYTQEDPMQVLYDAGYTKVASDQAGDASYSFAGLSGSLDHVLANDAALATVTGADVWEINANEAVAFEYSRYNYNATLLYEPNAYRASDHNPEVVGMTAQVRAEATVHAKVAPKVVKVDRGRAKVKVRVVADGARATGDVEAYVDGELVASATLRRGKAKLSIGPFSTTGVQEIEIRYLGNDTTAPADTTVSVRVVRRGR